VRWKNTTADGWAKPAVGFQAAGSVSKTDYGRVPARLETG
jgi:hypothetical protein